MLSASASRIADDMGSWKYCGQGELEIHKRKCQPVLVGVSRGIFLVTRGGIEPPTQEFSRRTSTFSPGFELIKNGRVRGELLDDGFTMRDQRRTVMKNALRVIRLYFRGICRSAADNMGNHQAIAERLKPAADRRWAGPQNGCVRYIPDKKSFYEFISFSKTG